MVINGTMGEEVRREAGGDGVYIGIQERGVTGEVWRGREGAVRARVLWVHGETMRCFGRFGCNQKAFFFQVRRGIVDGWMDDSLSS